MADKHRVLVERTQARRILAVGEQDPNSARDLFNEIIRHPVPIDMNTLTGA